MTFNKSDRIQAIQLRISEIEEERKSLLNELAHIRQETSISIPPLIGQKISDTIPGTNDEKVKLFLKLFRCREDIYPKLWENKTKGINGYSPVCENEWKRGICNKPKEKCKDCSNRKFLPLNENVVRSHLEGKVTIGTYAIREDDKCTFIAADFDKSSWMEDVSAYKHKAREFGVDEAVEISHSGNGAHAWIFFSEPVPAYLARRLGTVIMAQVSSNKYQLTLDSYDRFFPSQDFMPKGGFGNLIALPLQRKLVANGNTVFVNNDFTPYDDHWEYLSNVYSLSEQDIHDLLDDIMPAKTGYELFPIADNEVQLAERAIDPISGEIENIKCSREIVIELNSRLAIELKGLPAQLISSLKRLAIFANPKFFELQRMRFSTWNTPQYICCAELSENRILLPRGTIDGCKEVCESTQAPVRLIDNRPHFENIDISFNGELTKKQNDAVREVLDYDYGVLVAPPGFGKTILGCAIINNRRVPTLILVDRKQLVDQWIERLTAFLNIEKKEIGVLGGGRKKQIGKIDIAMLQTLARSDNAKETLSIYEQVIVDECHHIPAVSFEEVLNDIPAHYFLGLTATPYRKDGHQAIIHMQCGPIRHEVEEYGSDNLEKKVIIRETQFKMPEQSAPQPPIHEVWENLIVDSGRLDLVAEDVRCVIDEGRFPLILSERKEHLKFLSDKISSVTSDIDVNEYVFVGDTGKKARKKAFEEIQSDIKNSRKFYILATGSLLGEGFDLPELDTLFIAMPFSFKGRTIQYAGRLHRESSGKKDVIIYDYLDINSGLTISMFKKRISAYKEMGYEIVTLGNPKVERWAGQGTSF